MSRTGAASARDARQRASSLLALARPAPISMPEWPPWRPETVRTHLVPALSSMGREPKMSHRAPPAQLTVRTPSSSLSRLMSLRPFRSPQSRASAPSRPISSSAVNTASMGGWGMVPSSSTARIMATATPLSPPRVVPRALTQSPST